MGDHKLHVKITIVGEEDEATVHWCVNWSRDKPEELYKLLVIEAQKLGLDVDDKRYLFRGECDFLEEFPHD